MEQFLRGYIRAAIWSSVDDNDKQMDATYDSSDLDPETLSKMTKDCQKFIEKNDEDIKEDYYAAGVDFWLTRNGHGSGFWDGDWPQPAADRLTAAAHVFSESDLYVGDNGKLYVTP